MSRHGHGHACSKALVDLRSDCNDRTPFKGIEGRPVTVIGSSRSTEGSI